MAKKYQLLIVINWNAEDWVQGLKNAREAVYHWDTVPDLSYTILLHEKDIPVSWKKV